MGPSGGIRTPLPPERPVGQLSGSRYGPTHSGKGYVLEVLFDVSVLVYWFSFDKEARVCERNRGQAQANQTGKLGTVRALTLRSRQGTEGRDQ